MEKCLILRRQECEQCQPCGTHFSCRLLKPVNRLFLILITRPEVLTRIDWETKVIAVIYCFGWSKAFKIDENLVIKLPFFK